MDSILIPFFTSRSFTSSELKKTLSCGVSRTISGKSITRSSCDFFVNRIAIITPIQKSTQPMYLSFAFISAFLLGVVQFGQYLLHQLSVKRPNQIWSHTL